MQEKNNILTENFGTRLKKLRQGKNLTQTELAEAIGGRSNSHISDLEKDIGNPGASILISLSRYFEVSIDYLLTGKNNNALALSRNEDIPIRFWHSVEVSAGKGLNADQAEMYEDMSIPIEIFQHAGFNNLKNLNAFRVYGDSMAPAFPHGCMAIFVPSKKLADGDIYVFSFLENLLMKKIHFYASRPNVIRLISLNKEYEAEDITITDDPHFRIIGRVIGSINPRSS